MKKKIAFILFVLFFINTNLISLENRILMKVDNEIITTVDISNQINYLVSLNPKIKELENQRVFEIAKQTMIKEKIKKLEILKKIEKIDIEDKYLNEYLKTKYQSLGFEDENKFENYLKINDLTISTIKEKISIELIWNQLIYEKFNKSIKIDEEAIKNKILNYKNQKSKRYLLSEIVFQASDDFTIDEKYELIKSEIDQSGFENTAAQYSISNTAITGGKIGWINENSLNSNIKKVVSMIELGSYSQPIQLPSGFLILYVKDIQEINEEVDIDIEKEIAKNIKISSDQQLNDFSNIYFNKIKKNFLISEI
jgi:peptidyl-prolyl cis-trans isomerase SurA